MLTGVDVDDDTTQWLSKKLCIMQMQLYDDLLQLEQRRLPMKQGAMQ
jgi:hypothetical protein